MIRQKRHLPIDWRKYVCVMKNMRVKRKKKWITSLILWSQRSSKKNAWTNWSEQICMSRKIWNDNHIIDSIIFICCLCFRLWNMFDRIFFSSSSSLVMLLCVFCKSCKRNVYLFICRANGLIDVQMCDITIFCFVLFLSVSIL